MEENKNFTQQAELLQSVTEYVPKAVSELKKLAAEFYGIKQEDSDEYLEFVLNNCNWVIEAMNATRPLLAEEGLEIEKEKGNQVIADLNAALADKMDIKIADALEKGLIPLMEKFLAAAEVIGKKM